MAGQWHMGPRGMTSSAKPTGMPPRTLWLASGVIGLAPARAWHGGTCVPTPTRDGSECACTGDRWEGLGVVGL